MAACSSSSPAFLPPVPSAEPPLKGVNRPRIDLKKAYENKCYYLGCDKAAYVAQCKLCTIGYCSIEHLAKDYKENNHKIICPLLQKRNIYKRWMTDDFLYDPDIFPSLQLQRITLKVVSFACYKSQLTRFLNSTPQQQRRDLMEEMLQEAEKRGDYTCFMIPPHGCILLDKTQGMRSAFFFYCPDDNESDRGEGEATEFFGYLRETQNKVCSFFEDPFLDFQEMRKRRIFFDSTPPTTPTEGRSMQELLGPLQTVFLPLQEFAELTHAKCSKNFVEYRQQMILEELPKIGSLSLPFQEILFQAQTAEQIWAYCTCTKEELFTTFEENLCTAQKTHLKDLVSSLQESDVSSVPQKVKSIISQQQDPVFVSALITKIKNYLQKQKGVTLEEIVAFIETLSSSLSYDKKLQEPLMMQVAELARLGRFWYCLEFFADSSKPLPERILAFIAASEITSHFSPHLKTEFFSPTLLPDIYRLGCQQFGKQIEAKKLQQCVATSYHATMQLLNEASQKIAPFLGFSHSVAFILPNSTASTASGEEPSEVKTTTFDA